MLGAALIREILLHKDRPDELVCLVRAPNQQKAEERLAENLKNVCQGHPGGSCPRPAHHALALASNNKENQKRKTLKKYRKVLNIGFFYSLFFSGPRAPYTPLEKS